VLSVVMPAHNEEGLLETSVRDVTEQLRARNRQFELVVVENGSTDDTAAIATRLAQEVPEVRALTFPRPDYGGALRTGFLEARGDLVVIFDVDFYEFAFLDKAVDALEQPNGPDVVIGSKRGEGSVDTRAWSRRLVTSVFSQILRVGFGLHVSDTHGIKVVRRAPLKDVAAACRYGTDLFDTELVLRAERAGLKVTEIPVVVEERRPSRTGIARRVPRTLWGLTRLRVALWRERE
jgi:glycosyltransferase involved in cell wall biosynthesis